MIADRAIFFSLGCLFTAATYAGCQLLGQALFNRSVIYPH